MKEGKGFDTATPQLERSFDSCDSKPDDDKHLAFDHKGLPSKGTKKVSLLTTAISLLAAIVVGLSAGKEYAILLGQAETVTQCMEETNSSIAERMNLPPKLTFQFAEQQDDDDEDDDDEDDDDEKSNGNGNGMIYELHILAEGLEDHFEEYNLDNGEDLVSELLEGILEASDECEEIFQLHGHFAVDARKHGGKYGVIEALGMLEGGHVNLLTWPDQGKLMTSFQMHPPREVGDEDNLNDGIIASCVDSIAKFLYPDDIVKPDGLKGSVNNVSHLTQMGAFDVLTKHQKDPLRFVWFGGKGRGFRNLDPNEFDIAEEFDSSDSWSRHVESVQSPFQRIDIVDAEDHVFTVPLLKYFTDPELAEERKYIEEHRAFFEPDRVLFLDGVTQSTKEGLAAYHEALVQPAMFTHPNPKRVAIVGGGECATLRETLKHNTVEKVVMVEIDPVIVEVSKHFLPDWNDCSMFEGSSRYCMDDPRVEMYHLDALKWFVDRFSEEARVEGNEHYGTVEKFDVVILDALDPQNAVDFVEALYGDGPFMNSLYNSLTDDGVLLTQVGEAIGIDDLAENYPGNFNFQRYAYETGLKNQGFNVIFSYEEPRAGFDGIWSFYAAFKSDISRARWQMNEAQFDLEIQKRSIRRVDADSVESGELKGLMDYFDGATMKTYRYPSKHAQIVYCQRDPKPEGCVTDVQDHVATGVPIREPSGFDPNVPNLSADQFVVGTDNVLVSKMDMPELSYLMLEQSIHDVQITPSMTAILQGEESLSNSAVANFVSGDQESTTGATYSTHRIDSGLLSLLKHDFETNLMIESQFPVADTKDKKDLVFHPSHTRNSHLPPVLKSSLQ